MPRWRTLLPAALIVSFAAIPFATLAAANGRAITLAQLLPYLLAATALPLAVVAIIGRRRGLRAAEPAACALGVALLLVFDFRDLSPVLRRLASESTISTLFLWATLTAIAAVLTARVARRHTVVPVYLLLASLLVLVPPLVKALGYQISRPQPAVTFAPPLIAADRPPPRARPDVYFFMLDAYARGDRLQHRFGFRDNGFQRFLGASGFVVPPRSHTDYAVTTLSAASMLDMSYPVRDGAYSWESMQPFHVGRNRAVSSFKRLGYRFALAPSGIGDYTCRGYQDICIPAMKTAGTRLGWSDLTWAVVDRTPAADVIERLLPTDPTNSLGAARQFPVDVVQAVARHRDARPVFTYAHVLLTHPPYLYQGPRCAFQPEAETRTAVAAYLGTVECANAQVERAVRMITTRNPNAIVVLASDHGSDVRVPHGTPQWQWPRLTLSRRFSNFVALRLPPACRRDVPPDIAAVNVLRVVLSCVSGQRIPMVAGERYLVDEIAQRVQPSSVKPAS